ncbi:unnamed protein product [Closterium sp. NIES-53]
MSQVLLLSLSLSVLRLSGVELALSSDVLEERQFELECLVAALPRFTSMLLCPEGDLNALDIPTLRSYAEAIAGAVKRPPGSLPAFEARYVARGFCKRQGVDFFQTFSPTPKMTTLRVLLHERSGCAEEIWLRRPPGFTGTTLAALGFAPSTADPSLILRTDTTLPLFYVLVYVLQRFDFQFSLPQPTPLSTGHSLSAPPSDEFVKPSGLYRELLVCLVYLMTSTRPDSLRGSR